MIFSLLLFVGAISAIGAQEVRKADNFNYFVIKKKSLNR